MSDTQKTYDENNIPADAQAYSQPNKEYTPLEDGVSYQVEIKEIILKDNIFYKEKGENGKPEGSKYVFSFTYVILDEGEFRGRRIWDNASPVLKPDGKKGASKLYKIVTKTMGSTFDWDMCGSFAPDMATLFKNLKLNVLNGQMKVTIESTVDKESKKNKVKVVAYSQAKLTLPTYVSDKDAEQKSLDEQATKISTEAKAQQVKDIDDVLPPTQPTAPTADADPDWITEAVEASQNK